MTFPANEPLIILLTFPANEPLIKVNSLHDLKVNSLHDFSCKWATDYRSFPANEPLADSLFLQVSHWLQVFTCQRTTKYRSFSANKPLTDSLSLQWAARLFLQLSPSFSANEPLIIGLFPQMSHSQIWFLCSEPLIFLCKWAPFFLQMSLFVSANEPLSATLLFFCKWATKYRFFSARKALFIGPFLQMSHRTTLFSCKWATPRFSFSANEPLNRCSSYGNSCVKSICTSKSMCSEDFLTPYIHLSESPRCT